MAIFYASSTSVCKKKSKSSTISRQKKADLERQISQQEESIRTLQQEKEDYKKLSYRELLGKTFTYQSISSMKTKLEAFDLKLHAERTTKDKLMQKLKELEQEIEQAKQRLKRHQVKKEKFLYLQT